MPEMHAFEVSPNVHGRWVTAPAAAMAGTAALQASAPAILHLSAPGSNPLMFHVVLLTAEVALLAAVLAVVAARAGPAAGWTVGVLRDADVHLCYFRRGGPSQPLVVMRTARVGAAAGWGRLPLLWVCVGSCDYALLAWASSFAETAAVVALYGLWPLWLVWMLSRRAAANVRSPGSRLSVSRDAPRSAAGRSRRRRCGVGARVAERDADAGRRCWRALRRWGLCWDAPRVAPRRAGSLRA